MAFGVPDSFSQPVVSSESEVAIAVTPYTNLLEYYSEFLSTFNRLETKKLPLLRGLGTDYTIKLEEVNRKEPLIP